MSPVRPTRPKQVCCALIIIELLDLCQLLLWHLLLWHLDVSFSFDIQVHSSFIPRLSSVWQQKVFPSSLPMQWWTSGRHRAGGESRNEARLAQCKNWLRYNSAQTPSTRQYKEHTGCYTFKRIPGPSKCAIPLLVVVQHTKVIDGAAVGRINLKCSKEHLLRFLQISKIEVDQCQVGSGSDILRFNGQDTLQSTWRR